MSVQEALPSQIKSPPYPSPPPTTTTKEDKRIGNGTTDSNPRPGIQVPRQRYISVSKSELLDAIVSAMFPSQEEARQFLSLALCLDSILHAEHKIILEEMRADFDLTLSTKSKTRGLENSPSLRGKVVANKESDAFMNNSTKSESIYKEQGDEADTEILMSSGFTQYLKLLMDFSLKAAKRNPIKALRNPIKSSRVVIPGRFQHAFMKLLHNAGFEELSPRDLMLTSALNTDYLLTLPIYVDWKKASESNVIIFRDKEITNLEN